MSGSPRADRARYAPDVSHVSTRGGVPSCGSRPLRAQQHAPHMWGGVFTGSGESVTDRVVPSDGTVSDRECPPRRLRLTDISLTRAALLVASPTGTADRSSGDVSRASRLFMFIHSSGLGF